MTPVKADGKDIGVSTWIGYSSNEGRMLSLAMIDPAYVKMGDTVTRFAFCKKMETLERAAERLAGISARV